MSNNPTHVKLYIGKQFHKMLKDVAENYEEWGVEDWYNHSSNRLAMGVDMDSELKALVLSKAWRMKLTGAKRVKTFYRWRKVTIPTWSIATGRDHSLYYMLHELAHVVTIGHGHDEEFRRVEDKLLAVYGITIVRRAKSPYPKTISMNGEVIHEDVR